MAADAESGFLENLRRVKSLRLFRQELDAYSVIPQEPQLVLRLKKLAARERLTLVLGAGVSKSVKLPIWSELVSSLVRRTFPPDSGVGDLASEFLLSGSSDPLRTVAALASLLRFDSALSSEVRKCLYETYDPTLESALLEPLCTRLLLTSRACRVFNVITYNFDDTLEACLRRLGGRHSVVYSADTYANAGRGLKIFHPHGYLPMQETSSPQEEVVFAEADYHAQYASSAGWANVLQMHHLFSRRCLFVGFSVNDPNVRRLLSLQAERSDKEGALRHVTIQIASTDKVASYFLEKQLGQLGVQVLWVERPDDVPRVLEDCFS